MLRLCLLLFLTLTAAARAETLTQVQMAALVSPPNILGEPLGEGVYELLNSGGGKVGYAFQTEPLASLPGFSGAPIQIFATIDLEGQFLDVRLVDHNEPIFVSGLGQAPFRAFFEQYPGLSLNQSLVVGTPYGDGAVGSGLVYLDGVTKATASVRIAHESLLAAAGKVARAHLQGVATGPPARPAPDTGDKFTWQDLVDQGIVSRLLVTNAEIDALFAGSLWADDDPEAREDPGAAYLDLWIVDLGPPAIARAALSPEGYEEVREFLTISTEDEPLLMIDAGRHGLVSPDFVRNTAPDWIAAMQDGLPIALRDADLYVAPAADAPAGTAMILRTDRRLGFDPTRPLDISITAVREHGSFMPEIGTREMQVSHVTPERFFVRPEPPRPLPQWKAAIVERQADLIILAAFLAILFALLGPGQSRFAAQPRFPAIRLTILAAMLGFVGWWGQGQLSIVTVLGVLRAAIDRASLAFLLYDPFSLLIWVAAIVGFVLWGRGLFCGWLCPFGALQEIAAALGRALRLPRIEPSSAWDARLKWMKYIIVAGLVGVTLFAPSRIDTAAEIEPFKTAITVFFVREWYYVAYAVGVILASALLFKGFCRYLCPLGAVMAIGGLFRGRDWIARRIECGSPCQLCRVECNYGAIAKSGSIQYDECFQCLDCVSIHDDRQRCVPLVLADRAAKRRPQVAAQ